jgi:hypothetical protein
MTRGWSISALAVALALGVACGSDDEETRSQGTGGGGTGGSSTGGTGGSSTGGSSTGGSSTGGSSTGGSSTGGGGGNAGSTGGSAGADAAAGSAGVAGAVADAAADGPIVQDWPNVLYSGVWLAGWSGGLDHYSWLEFTPSSASQPNGTWAALDLECTSCTGYFACEGSDGLFAASGGGPKQEIVLQYPQACQSSGETWTIVGMSSSPSFPPGALLSLDVQVDPSSGPSLTMLLYPKSQCNAAFTSCTSPF